MTKNGNLWKVLIVYDDKRKRSARLTKMSAVDNFGYHLALTEGWHKTRRTAKRNFAMVHKLHISNAKKQIATSRAELKLIGELK